MNFSATYLIKVLGCMSWLVYGLSNNILPADNQQHIQQLAEHYRRDSVDNGEMVESPNCVQDKEPKAPSGDCCECRKKKELRDLLRAAADAGEASPNRETEWREYNEVFGDLY